MRIFQELKRVFQALQPFDGYWCLCGGVAASVYGGHGRFTNDIDLAIVDTPQLSARGVATQVLEQLGYQPVLGYLRDPTGVGTEQVLSLIVGRVAEVAEFVKLNMTCPCMFIPLDESVHF